MGDDDQRWSLDQQAFELFDGGDVEVVGRLVEQQQIGLAGQCGGQRRPFALTTGQPLQGRLQRHRQPFGRGGEGGNGLPVVAVLVFVVQAHAHLQALAERVGGRQDGFLFNGDHPGTVGGAHIAVVKVASPADDGQQRRLAGAVATDQADALARFDKKLKVIEKRGIAEREFGAKQRQ